MKLYSLLNLGNTCYLNSVLQCFINNPCFANFPKKDSELTELLKEINIDLTVNNEHINHKHDPNKIVTFFNKKFRRFEQHDAHEFLLEFLDILDLKDYCGKFKMNITCSSCKNVSSTYEDYSTINLHINLENNLTDSFINYLKKENIHDYHCEKCNEKVLADKKVYIYNLPNFLILVLKRYNINGKLNNSISYPLENMKIRETESGEIFSYILYAIIYHYGHSHNGHYNCNVKINNNWYFIDDDSIYLNNNIENNNCNSYILFYKKC